MRTPLLRCPDCNTICKGSTGLSRHRHSRHSPSSRPASQSEPLTPADPTHPASSPSPSAPSGGTYIPSSSDSEADDHPAGQIACPTCLSTYLGEAAYIAHLRATHAEADDLTPYQLDIPQRLLFCPYCHLICRGSRGLTYHRNRCPQRPATNTAPEPTSSPLSPSALAAAADRDLLPLFSRGVHNPHRSWPAPIGKILNRLLNTSCDLQNTPAACLATSCALILPGLIEEGHRSHHLHIGHMLQDLGDAADTVASDTDFAARLLNYARRIAPSVSAYQERVHARTTSGGSSGRSVDSLKSSIERLVKERRLGSAMVLVDQLQPLLGADYGPPSTVRTPLTTSEVSDLISSLHPPSTAADEFTAEQLAAIAASTALTISADDIPALLVASLPPGSAAGASGWTYALLQSLFKPTTNPLMVRRLSETFARLINSILSGKHPSALLLRVRSVLIPKASGGYRPLGIGDALYRLACRAALAHLGPGLGSVLSPLQLVIGISGGCEIGGRIGQLIMASPPATNLIITSTDLKNGFNELGRSKQLDGLIRFAPGLLRWFQWAYGRPTPLIMHGTTVGHSSTGCRQGDPLSSLCFCVGIHGVLEEAVAAMRTLIEGHIGSSPVGGLFAYIDDITFFYDGCLSSPMEATLRQIFASNQIPLNMAKCYHLVHPSSELSAGPHLFPIQFEGEPILGCPTGTAEFRRSFASAKVSAATSSLPALALLQPWSTWNLLRSCVSPRLGYLARVLEPADTAAAFSQFDDCIDEAVFDLANVSDPTDKQRAGFAAFRLT